MDFDKLSQANELAGRINKVDKLLQQLTAGQVNIVISRDKQPGPLMTIGTGDDCEHSFAPLATDFLSAVRAMHEANRQKLMNEFSQL